MILFGHITEARESTNQFRFFFRMTFSYYSKFSPILWKFLNFERANAFREDDSEYKIGPPYPRTSLWELNDPTKVSLTKTSTLFGFDASLDTCTDNLCHELMLGFDKGCQQLFNG